MLDIAFSLFDYFIKLAEKKEGSLDEYFDVYVQPAYAVAEQVFSDYLDILHELKKKILVDTPFDELIQFLEDRRIKYLPLRRRLYAEVQSRWSPEFDYQTLPAFEKGLIGLLLGTLPSLDISKPEIMAGPAIYSSPYGDSHTLKDMQAILIHFQKRLLENKDLSLKDQEAQKTSARFYCNARVDDQIRYLEQAWADVVKGYSGYKVMVAATPAKVQKLKPKKK